MANLAYGTLTITNLSVVTSVDVYYYNSTSPSSLSGDTWRTNTPTWTDGKYIWSKTVTTWEQGVTTQSEPVCITGQRGSTGATGQSVTRITQQYALGSNSTTPPTSGWSTAMPAFESGKFYWTRSEIVWTNPSSTTYTTAVLANGLTSANTNAETAKTDAASAVSTANTANQTANTANQTANTANQTANTANQTAQNAVSIANGKNTIYYSSSKPTGGTYKAGDTWFNLTTDGYRLYEYDATAKDWVQKSMDGKSITAGTVTAAQIHAGAITTDKLATNAIKSVNYAAGTAPYSLTGTFLDLSNGNIFTPNFGVNNDSTDNIDNGAYIKGTIQAYDGKIGSDNNNYWYIGNYFDYNQGQSAMLRSHGTAAIQLGDSNTWRVSTDRIHTAWNDDSTSGQAFRLHYPSYGGKYWDSGLHVPTSATDKLLYIRNAATTVSLENLQNDINDNSGGNYWNYQFYLTNDGSLYAKNIYIMDDSGNTTQIGGTDGVYLLKSGGTITGNLTVNGTLTATASQANALTHTLSINGQSWTGSSNLTINTLGVAYGGTGKTTGKDAANYFLNSLDTGSSTPVDGDYYISQYVGGGTTTTTYHRRPMSALWLYVKSKLSAADMYVPKTGGTFTGAVHVEDEFYADSATLGNLIVNGSGRFNNGIYGDLTGTATRATKVTDSGNSTDITFAYSKTGMTTTSWLAAWNGYELRAISPANVLTTIGAQPAGNYVSKSGDTMTGDLTVPTIKVNSIVNEGYTHRIDFGRQSYNYMNFYEYGGVYNFYRNTVTGNADNATLLGKITINGWEGNVVGNATSATKATNDGDGNKISSTYLKLSGGTLTKADGVSYTAQDGEVIVSNPTSIIQSPIPKYLWHDLLAFCKIRVPNYYTTSDGTTWVTGTLEKKIFANMENWGSVQILNSNKQGSRWEWINAGLYACMASWIVIGVTYANPIAKFDLLVETSSDSGSTWTQLTSSTGLYYNQTPIWIKIGGTFQDSVRITITRNADSAANAPLPICSLKLLTRRWGDQGKGSELEYPYTWDGEGNITAKGTFTGTFNGNATSANSATTATKLNSTRSFTVGKTAKNVDWSGAVSFSQTEISDNASTSAAGWMSKDDKVKLNGIETGAQVNTITGVKGNSETSYRTGNVNITASNIGLGNVTNNKQVKGLSSGTTSGNLVTWGSDGYTVADSGIAKESVTTKITLSGTDYSVSSNTITITKANLQSAVQDTSLVLMTSAERSKLSSIQVSEGGTIDFSGVTASAPITATVNQTTKAVNITHNTSGITAGTYRSVTVNTYGHVTAGTNPTTLSGYGITDAKIASGVITLGSNTITPLTASSTLDATKLSGTASISTTGNATTATKFSSNRSIALSGDTTGSASSNGESGWSITTKTSKMTTLADNRSVATTPNDYKNQIIFQGLKSNGYINSPSNTTYSYLVGLRGWSDNSGGNAHELAFNDNGIFRRNGATDTWGNWYKLIDSGNYNSYSPTLTGTGASGTWDIDISGNATTATSATKANITTVANSIAKYSDTSGTFTDSYITIDSSGNLIIGDNDHPVNIKMGAKNDNYGLMPNVNNYGQIGSSSLYWYRGYINNYYGTNSHVTNWDSDKNIGTAATANAASTLGNVNFYNTCAAGGTQTKTKLTADASTASNITITLPSETGKLALTKNYQPYVHYSNTNGNNSGKYYKISINSYTGWMLSFTIRIYHTYRAYDLQISGYNYGSNHWYSPSAIILGSSVTTSIDVLFGYDSDYHLWVAIPAQQYTGIDVVNVTNGYQQVDSLEGLFTIEMVDGEPTTVQDTKTAYRPWYRNETVTTATTATSAGALTNKTLDSLTLNSTVGTFSFQGSGVPWDGTDWVGLQVGSNDDKFQIHALNGTTLEYRQNDSGGTNSNWGDWYSLLSAGNYTDYTVTKTGTGASGTWGISITGNAATATSATSATTATKVGDSSIWLYANNNNEINFGGTNTGTTIFMGYRATDSRPIPTKFVFGGGTGTADLQAKTVYLGSGTTSYITNTQYTGNAATATKATQDKNGNDITTKYVTMDTTQTISGRKTFNDLAVITFKPSSGTDNCSINYDSTLGALVFSF